MILRDIHMLRFVTVQEIVIYLSKTALQISYISAAHISIMTSKETHSTAANPKAGVEDQFGRSYQQFVFE